MLGAAKLDLLPMLLKLIFIEEQDRKGSAREEVVSADYVFIWFELWRSVQYAEIRA